MARLPGAEALGERPVPVLPRRTPMVAEYRSGTGMEDVPAQTQAHTSAEFQQTANVVFQAKEQQDTLAAEDAFNKLRLKLTDLTYGKDGIMAQKGSAAMNRDLPAEYGGRLSKESEALSGSLGNEYQKTLFARRAATAQFHIQEQAAHHQARESDVYANQVLQGTLDTESRVAAAGGDVATSMLRINSAIDRHAERFHPPEQEVTALKMKAADGVWSAKLKALVYAAPLEAKKLFDNPEVRSQLGPVNRAVLEHELKTAIRPIEAKAVAEKAMTAQAAQGVGGAMDVGGEPVVQAVVAKETGPNGFPKESEGERLTAMQRRLEILKDEKVEPGQEAAQAREIASTEATIASLSKRASAAPTSSIPTTKRDLRAHLGDFVTRAEALAEHLHPGDALFRDMAVAQVKGKVSTIAAAFEGIQRQAHSTLLTHLSGGPDGKAAKPTTMDELFAMPGAREAYAHLDAASLHGISSALQQNQIEAMGRPVRTDPKVEKELFDRIHLPDDDPRKISSPAQLTSYFSKGINHGSYDWLKKEIDQQMSAGGRSLTADLQTARLTAHAMITRSPMGSIQPDKAEEAAYRFRNDLNQKVAEYQKAGKDPRVLITPGNPDYMLTPERVASYMPSARLAVSEEAKKKLPVVSNDADFEKLPDGATFVGPDGHTRVKPVAPKSTAQKATDEMKARRAKLGADG